MKEPELLTLISTSRRNQSRIQSVNNTWAKHIDHLYYSDHQGKKKLEINSF